MTARTEEGWTPIQQRLIDALSDGNAHHAKELLKLVDPFQDDKDVLHQHISRMRKILRVRGQDIVCETTGWKFFYRHIRLLRHPGVD